MLQYQLKGMTNIVFKLCELLLLVTLMNGAQIVSLVNYGLYLGNVTVNSISIKYDWNINQILNGMFQRPILPANQTQAQFDYLNSWVTSADSKITIASANSQNLVWNTTNQILLLRSESTSSVVQTFTAKEGKFAVKIKFAQNNFCQLGTGALMIQINGITVGRIVPIDKQIHYFINEVNLVSGNNYLRLSAFTIFKQFQIGIDDVGIYPLVEQKNYDNKVYAVAVGSVKFTTPVNSDHVNYQLDYLLAGQAGAWCAKFNNLGQWIQVSIPEIKTWTSVILQGRPDWNGFVQTYKVMYSVTGASTDWKYVDNGRIFTGNTDQNSKVRADFDIPVRARAIRIHPVTWNNWICLRFDAIYIDQKV